jgi:hypothetical protein
MFTIGTKTLTFRVKQVKDFERQVVIKLLVEAHHVDTYELFNIMIQLLLLFVCLSALFLK